MKTNHLRVSAAHARATTLRTGLHIAALPVLVALALPGLARADAVTDWNTESHKAAATAGAPPIQARVNAISHLAIHDALNSIAPRYQSYAGSQPTAPGASPEAAVAAAAFVTLFPHVPASAMAGPETYRAYLERIYHEKLDAIACPPAYPGCVEDGVAVGALAGQAILALRAGDGAATPHADYSEPLDPGVYQRTPGSPLPQFGNWGKVVPFALNHSKQFRPWSPLLDMSSDTYVQEYVEVVAVGSAAVRNAALAGSDPAERSKSLSTPFWAGGGGNVNLLTQAVAAGRGLDMWEHARLFALVNMAQMDASIVLFDAKYAYKFWRPVTAIRVTEDPAWTPYLSPTPPYPDYPSGLASLVGSATGVMREFFGTDALPFDMTSLDFAGNPNPRHFDTLTQAQNDAAMSRVYGGIHFRSACMDGAELGNKVGHYVFRHYLKPL